MSAQLASYSLRATSTVVFSADRALARRSQLHPVRPLASPPALEEERALGAADDGPLVELPWPAPSHVGAGHLFFFMR